MEKIILNGKLFRLSVVQFNISFRSGEDRSKLYMYGIWMEMNTSPAFDVLQNTTFGNQVWTARRSDTTDYIEGSNFLFWAGHWWQLTNDKKIK